MEKFEEIAEEGRPGSKAAAESLLQFMTRDGTSPGLKSRALDLADAIFANDYGATMSQIGVQEVHILSVMCSLANWSTDKTPVCG